MTTLRQLRTLAKPVMIPRLQSLGFDLKQTLNFVRRRRLFFDIIRCEVLSSGENLRVQVYCWSSRLDPSIPPERIPIGCPIVTGGPLGRSEEIPDYGSLWNVRTTGEAAESLLSVLQQIESVAIPWFDQIIDPATYLEKVDINVKDTEYWQEVQAALMG